MGAIAESIVAYAQPLIEQTDGSVERIAMHRVHAIAAESTSSVAGQLAADSA